MIRHLFKLVWNRKRTNALIILEIFFSFLVVFVVATLGVVLPRQLPAPARASSGKNVWNVRVDRSCRRRTDEAALPSRWRRSSGCSQEVQSIAGRGGRGRDGRCRLTTSGDSDGSWTSTAGTWRWRSTRSPGTSLEVMGLRARPGRWFQKADEALAWQPVVIDADLARDGLRHRDPVGRPFGEPDPRSASVAGGRRGERLPQAGELIAERQFHVPARTAWATPRTGRPRNLLVRVRAGHAGGVRGGAGRSAAGAWLPTGRSRSGRWRSCGRLDLPALPDALIVGGIVALFLLLMVGLGLIGVLWQNLLQRTREIGLRRATGRLAPSVHRQVLAGAARADDARRPAGTSCWCPDPDPRPDRLHLEPGVRRRAAHRASSRIYLLSMLCALYPAPWPPGCSRPRPCAMSDPSSADHDPDRRRRPVGRRFPGPAPEAPRPPRPRAARSPEEALAPAAGEEFDLVLQDMNFSRGTTGEEGLELLGEIRRLRPRLPVILITAWGSIAPGGRGDEGRGVGLRHQAVGERPAPPGGGDGPVARRPRRATAGAAPASRARSSTGASTSAA